MLEKCKDAQERWGGVHQLIDKWLNDRQNLIVHFCNLSASKPLSTEEPLGESIQKFCQMMMDYCSAGHFEIYEQLMNEAREFDDGSIDFADQHMPRLEQLTGSALTSTILLTSTALLKACLRYRPTFQPLAKYWKSASRLKMTLLNKCTTFIVKRLPANSLN